MKKTYLKPLFILAIVGLFTSCSKDNTGGTSRLIVNLTDSPGDYDSVNVDIQSVQVHSNPNASDSDNGWTTLPNSQAGAVNLLDYTNGTELTLSDSEFPTGKISQIRLVLGSDNQLYMDGNTMDLETPSAQQSGLKLLVNTTLNAGVTYKFTLDFDASKSVVKTGSGKYILKPVIKVITEAESGAISGVVNPASENVAVLVMSGPEDTVASSYAPADASDYLVPGVPEGTYDLIFDPGETSTYAMDTLKGIQVTLGDVTEADTVELSVK